MSLLDKLGFGTQEKTPFKVPREVRELRTRIDTENKENFPSLAHYKAIASDADRVCQLLNQIIAQKENAGEAARLRDEIRAKLDGLREKIKKNMQDAQKDVKADYVARNIDYLERKSYRNRAKTLFTGFLENFAVFERFCRDGSEEHGKKIASVTDELFQTVADLQKSFFTKYWQDREIQAIKEDVTRKMSEIRVLYAQGKPRFRERGLESVIDVKLEHMPGGGRKSFPRGDSAG